MEMIPVNAFVHYKSAFDIYPNEGDDFNPRKIIRKWCLDATSKYNNEVLLTSWFFKGDHNQYRIGQYFFRVCINVGTFSFDDPENWALEVIHSDSEYNFRKWSVEISISRTEENIYRFVTIVKNWIQPGYFGEKPSEPALSTPGYIKGMINLYNSVSKKGNLELLSKPYFINIGDGKKLAKDILSESRLLPLIVVSKKHDIESCDQFTINPWTLQYRVCGNANVYMLNSNSVNEELNYYLGSGYNCEVGTLRIYMPGIDKSRENDRLRHRYFTLSQINSRTEDQILNDISIGLSRDAKVFIPKEIYSIQGVISARRRSRLYDLAQQRTIDSEKSEELKLLWEELDELTLKNTEQDSRIQQLEMGTELLEQEKSDLSWQIKQLEQIKSENIKLKKSASILESLEDLPDSLAEIVNLVSIVFSDKLIFTDRAIESAKAHNMKDLNEAWRILRVMGTHLHSLFFDQSDIDIEKEFKNISGYDLSMTEGRQTKRDKELMKRNRQIYRPLKIILPIASLSQFQGSRFSLS